MAFPLLSPPPGVGGRLSSTTRRGPSDLLGIGNRQLVDQLDEGGAGLAGLADDRIEENQPRLGVYNGDLASIVAVQPDLASVTVRLDRDGTTRDLFGWYLEAGHVDYGYAMTGHKAQGVTTSRTFTVITGATDREWAYVALSRGRQANTLYLAAAGADERDCAHLTHHPPRDRVDELASALNWSTAQTAALDHTPQPGSDPYQDHSARRPRPTTWQLGSLSSSSNAQPNANIARLNWAWPPIDDQYHPKVLRISGIMPDRGWRLSSVRGSRSRVMRQIPERSMSTGRPFC